jgi:hypothetical protein
VIVVDPRVETSKFADEVRALENCAAVLRKRGCFLVRAEFPEVDVVFTPRWPVRISVVRPGGAVATSTVLPLAACRTFGARIDLRGFDATAPSVTFRDPRDWTFLPPGTIGGFALNNAGEAMPVLHPHPKTGRLFLCVQGIREYHDHPVHDGDDWLLHRGQYGLVYVVETIWRACVESARVVGELGPAGAQFAFEPVRGA